MNYKGKGLLIGYQKKTEKDGTEKHLYFVLNGNKDEETSLFSDCEFITIMQDEQTLEELKPQRVVFDIVVRNYGNSIRYKFENISADKK